MLPETECRVLNETYKILLADFDPRDAIIFLEGRGVFSEDNSEFVNSKSTRLERLHHFLRFFRRRAVNLNCLIEYFDYAGQNHIAEFLQNGVDVSLDSKREKLRPAPDTRMAKEALSRALLMGGVPRAASSFHRNSLLDSARESLCSLSFDSESFFVVLHGRAGVGKTFLASQLLSTSSELVGGVFESVIWLRDGSMEKHNVIKVFVDLLLMLRSDDEVHNMPDLDSLTSSQLKIMVRNALIDKPHALIVLDDVIQTETIDWAEQLGLRCLVTTRNKDVMDIVSSPLAFIEVSSLDDDESHAFLRCSRFSAPETPAEAEIERSAVRFASGNLAMLRILCQLSELRFERLSQLVRKAESRGVSTLICRTPYSFSNLHEALNRSVEELDVSDRDSLACLVLIPPNTPVPLEIWTSIIPVDTCDADELQEEVGEKLSRLRRKGSWTAAADGCFSVDALVHFYLIEVVDSAAIKGIIAMFEERVSILINNNGGRNALLQNFWFRLFGTNMTRERRAVFREVNIMNTYQPRALTSGYLFVPDPPTPCSVPIGRTNPSTFNELRDMHYKDEFVMANRQKKEFARDELHSEVVRIEFDDDASDSDSPES
ncbi:unnamed protein product [Caenorhabditis auriculariae]|uniref:NB-ARC domain-containing protein n=1 Tax=Caenorhabditis auriculariae TaxID=2777116 RepID=A0A8S1H3S8_9PELO|nr:unnamed protein product [Caenorhabditis auriculariae]